ncbi:MAG: helix-turn-helix domain-containing protein [Marinicaulis sp.]|nr:helix-turn-helix domain-containing protein [Marinicaulis sp.]NNE41018.1 helix-turn-helix domain-containing protein [Marinicaulis sp.]NNL87525.1 helix-turn-helix domain-containing protein [Marinicaulis sp.]
MRPDDKRLVRDLELFRDMDKDRFDGLLNAAFFQRFPERVELIKEGEPADFLHIVIDGTVELFAALDDRESTMTMLTPVSTFILAAVLKDAVYLMSARTRTRASVLMIPAQNVRNAMAEDPAFARSIVGELANCYRGVVRNQKNLKLRTGVERLASFLAHQQFRQGGGEKIQLPIDKKTLASMLGMTPENLSRSFSVLRHSGVTVDGPTITIGSIDDLKETARHAPLIDNFPDSTHAKKPKR